MTARSAGPRAGVPGGGSACAVPPPLAQRCARKDNLGSKARRFQRVPPPAVWQRCPAPPGLFSAEIVPAAAIRYRRRRHFGSAASARRDRGQLGPARPERTFCRRRHSLPGPCPDGDLRGERGGQHRYRALRRPRGRAGRGQRGPGRALAPGAARRARAWRKFPDAAGRGCPRRLCGVLCAPGPSAVLGALRWALPVGSPRAAAGEARGSVSAAGSLLYLSDYQVTALEGEVG